MRTSRKKPLSFTDSTVSDYPRARTLRAVCDERPDAPHRRAEDEPAEVL